MHCIPQQGESIYIIKPAVPSWNLWGGDPVWQLLPRLSPPDSPVVTTQFGGHFQAVVRKYNSVTGLRGVTSEQVHVMPIHGHHQVPEGPLISDSANSGFFSSHIFDIIPGREVQVVTTTILGFHECLKATTKIKTFKSSLGGLSPRQSVAQWCRLLRGHQMVVNNGCRCTSYARRGRLPACSRSHTNESCTYRESCKSGKSDTRLFCLLGMTPEFRPASVSFVRHRECVFSSVQKG